MIKEPICRHCLEPMQQVGEGKTCYLYACENKECKAWHNAVEVPKTRLAEKLAQRNSPT